MAKLPGWTAATLLLTASAADHRPPAESRPAVTRLGSPSILPGGRIIAPAGKYYKTGPGAYGLAINPKGTSVVTASGGLNRYAITTVSHDRDGWHTELYVGDNAGREEQRVDSLGVAFEDDNDVYVSEGESGRALLVDSRNGRLKHSYDLNQGEFRGSYTGDLAFDPASKRLYVLDQANARLAIIDTGTKRLVGNARVGSLPVALAIAPGGKRVYVANAGMSDPEPNSVAVVDVSTPAKPQVVKFIRTGMPVGGRIVGGSSPAGIAATAERVYVSNAHNDSVSIIDAASLDLVIEIPMRFGGLEAYRGLQPVGLHYDPATKWLLVACAGINAITVIDVEKRQVIGLIPTAWFPTRVVVKDGVAWVNCAKGSGTGPNASRTELAAMASPVELQQGGLLRIPLPDAAELQKQSGTVFAANGLPVRPDPPAALPQAIEHVVVIVKENRSFDEVLGDVESAANGKVAGLPILARLGRYGVVNSRRGEFQTRLGLRNISVTPNHHALAQRFAFSDNFYAEAESDVAGHRWIVGAYPNAWRFPQPPKRAPVLSEELPEAGLLWHHLDRLGVSHREFGEFDMSVSDQDRASRFIKEMAQQPLPRLLFIHLPNDHMADPRPGDGYPYSASFVADNDLALGRIIEYFSNSSWWPKMAIFVTEDDAQGGIDHIDAHRTVLLAISPYAKRNYVSHVNTSFPSLIKTVLRLLRLPPLNLFDATAADLSGCFQATADLEPYKAQAVPVEVFDPGGTGQR